MDYLMDMLSLHKFNGLFDGHIVIAYEVDLPIS